MFVFRNYTIENLFDSDVLFSGYDDISFIPKDEDLLVWFYQVPVEFDVQNKFKAIIAYIDKLQYIVSNLSPAQSIIVCSLIDMFPFKMVDCDHRLSNAIYEFNQFAIDLASKQNNVKFLDIEDYFSQFPSNEWINWRFYFISQMVVAPAIAKNFKDFFKKKLLQINGQRKKCIVLDLDNTLWGGILGEDGIEGIKVGGDYPGNAFLYFQEALIELSKTGIILTVCSKNNLQDVLDAWEQNPFIKLKKDYIAAYRINWNNKADNIRELATELNIGLDSMVFIDDNASERELIRQQLPMVIVPDFPQKPYELLSFLSNLVCDYFKAYKLTNEDLNKTEQYRAKAERADFEKRFTDITEFIRSLEIKIDVAKADKFSIARLAQMTQKTNQFNLTTHRYSETDINNFINVGYKVYYISVSDKFGDNGITGEIICRIEGKKAFIDTFIMSCRILGKGIETAFFKAVANLLKADGISDLEAQYIPTIKNAQVADFYERQGMTLLSEKQGIKNYTLNLSNIFEIQDYYSINYK